MSKVNGIKKYCVLAASALAVSASAVAEQPYSVNLGKGIKLSIDGQANIDVGVREGQDETIQTQETELNVYLEMLEGKLKAHVQFEFERLLRENGTDVSGDFDLESAIEQMRFILDEVGGIPAVIVVGKDRPAFQELLSQLPIEENSLLFEATNYRQVIGVSVALNKETLQFVDELAVSIFEAGRNDLDIADEMGASMTISKKLTDKIMVHGSLMYLENEGTSKEEFRAGLGVVYNHSDKLSVAWEIVAFDDSVEYSNSDYITGVSVSYKLTDKDTLSAGAEYQDNEGVRVRAGYERTLTKFWSVALEGTYDFCDNGAATCKEGWGAWARTTVKLGAQTPDPIRKYNAKNSFAKKATKKAPKQGKE